MSEPPRPPGPAPGAPDGPRPPRDVPPERPLLRAVLADPHHLPEHLAWFALRHMGPAADHALVRLRERHPDADTARLRALVAAHGRRSTVAEGSLVGGPFLLLVPLAFCAALLNQARTVLELAGLDGRDPTSPERAAELLVLMGVYEDTARARTALATIADTAPVPRRALLRPRPLWDVTLRMARLLGLLTPPGQAEGGRSRRRLVLQSVRWAVTGAVFALSLVAPLVLLPYMAVSYHRATERLTDRAALFYFSEPPSARGSRVPGLSAAVLRAVLSLLLPAGLVVLVLLLGLRLWDSPWPAAVVALFGASVAVGAFWHLLRRLRRSRPVLPVGDEDGE
ncbi:hypothetical protein I3J09_26505 [Streptomyces clavuligerus]|uniref:Uncharacterized protein n=1 Tax=Streptomyces clavuligerus TaxID=1901 RepID=E2Q871_STRCL|nr:hypothetical protein BB341_26140 [Streptomyces clavuligerus]AXU16075.1 hypothetical protein D1794_27165 [Streptomyces clavuligerus]EFG05403.1 Hypothetical protein SCLAV_0327 [Streptomyces clavuligerus]MBY6306212.1 hypothetical protein [Streptomyces clavuligerus]QCS08853.1 hypothetical protein CRV15_26530 [Streptomyces clavuligerus]